MKTILVVDDEKEICRSLKGILSDEGYGVKTSYTPEEALLRLQEHYPHLILLDIWFGKGSKDGLLFLDKLKQKYPSLPVIVMSGHGTLELAVCAIKNGALDFIEKPIDIERLLLSIRRTLELTQLKKIISGQTQKGWALPLDQKLKKMALSDTCILLMGERGMEKNRIAYDIHKLSSKKEHSFVIKNAHVLNQLTDEAFLGKEIDGRVHRPGFLECIGEGTCLIYHVHMLNQNLQRYLEKIFETHSYTRIDGKQNVHLNVRFILTAPPEFLESKPHNMRKEFYDRVTLSPFCMKPLRAKKQDIVHWAQLFLEEISNELGEPSPSLSSEIVHMLQGYDWPGNLRELRNALERALIYCGTEPLQTMHFSEEISHIISCASIFSLPIQKARAIFEYNYLTAQLAAVNGNVSQAAPLIGMERSALHRKLKSLKMQKTEKLLSLVTFKKD